MMNIIYLQLTSANQLIKLPMALDFFYTVEDVHCLKCPDG